MTVATVAMKTPFTARIRPVHLDNFCVIIGTGVYPAIGIVTAIMIVRMDRTNLTPVSPRSTHALVTLSLVTTVDAFTLPGFATATTNAETVPTKMKDTTVTGVPANPMNSSVTLIHWDGADAYRISSCATENQIATMLLMSWGKDALDEIAQAMNGPATMDCV